jgi:hypothetical protein
VAWISEDGDTKSKERIFGKAKRPSWLQKIAIGRWIRRIRRVKIEIMGDGK